MNRDSAALLAALGVAALAVIVLVSPASPLVKASAGVSGHQGVTWSPTAPAAHVTRGGLFHPPAAGEGRTGLICWGWPWISNPPSESQTGLEYGT